MPSKVQTPQYEVAKEYLDYQDKQLSLPGGNNDYMPGANKWFISPYIT